MIEQLQKWTQINRKQHIFDVLQGRKLGQVMGVRWQTLVRGQGRARAVASATSAGVRVRMEQNFVTANRF
jgi:hypothetical protein